VVEEPRRGDLGKFRTSHEKESSASKFKPVRYTYSDIILNDHFVYPARQCNIPYGEQLHASFREVSVPES
jgi:hypothetical protein